MSDRTHISCSWDTANPREDGSCHACQLEQQGPDEPQPPDGVTWATVVNSTLSCCTVLSSRLAQVDHAEELAAGFLQCFPKNRLSAQVALGHPYFSDLVAQLWELPDSQYHCPPPHCTLAHSPTHTQRDTHLHLHSQKKIHTSVQKRQDTHMCKQTVYPIRNPIQICVRQGGFAILWCLLQTAGDPPFQLQRFREALCALIWSVLFHYGTMSRCSYCCCYF